ncbi:MAG TPA: tetratricopeptide repeat protein, partial [Pirellulaceae bacterium]|nr:tetratricopeptide repeat protein [Pirellulaceae bacterium]
ACWRRVETLDPKDEEAPRLVAALTIAKCRQQGGLESSNEAAPPSGASDKRHTRSVRRPVFRHTASLAAGATHPSGLSLSAIQQLEAAIRDRPSIPELYLRLAQLYLDKDRDYDAEKLLAKGREATDHDSQVQQMWEEVTMLRHARRVEIAEQEIKSADPAAADKAREALALAKKEQDRTDLEIFRGRVKRQPESAANHYELGVRLKRADKLREACEHLEKALGGSEERCAAAFELGDCHAQLGDLPQALRYYRLAAETPAAVGPSEAQKESLYQAGKLARRVKLAKLANRYLTQLVRIDPHHRDTAALVQST